jgi:adenine-specific DNA-methyltransferase
MWYPIEAPDGTEVWPIKPGGIEGRWRWMKETYDTSTEAVEFVRVKGRWEIYVKQFLDEEAARPPSTLWMSADVGHNHEAKLEAQSFNRSDVFATPKPERLLQRILGLATTQNEFVLDSFLGSGTTAAVAHKMGRRWIGIEMGEHALTHCLPRLRKVVDGEQGGISKAVNWPGGGGFRLLQLGAPLFDADGEIHAEVRYADLAAFVWMRETGTALADLQPGSPQLGVHEGTAYYLLFNGILGDRRPEGGNVLTSSVLAALHQGCPHAGPKVIYGEACRLGAARLQAEGIVFKQLPHAVPR